MKKFLTGYAIFIGLTCIPFAMAATIPLFTGVSGTNPVGFPAAQNDLNNVIAAINSNLASPASHTTAANGSVATVLGSLGPTGSHTTVQEWLQFTDSSGVVRYVPA